MTQMLALRADQVAPGDRLIHSDGPVSNVLGYGDRIRFQIGQRTTGTWRADDTVWVEAPVNAEATE